jgi:hypothetical protein
MKAKRTMRGQAISNHRRRKDKESESSIDSATHNQPLNKKTNGKNHHIPSNINTECQWTQLPPPKDTVCQTILKRKI